MVGTQLAKQGNGEVFPLLAREGILLWEGLEHQFFINFLLILCILCLTPNIVKAMKGLNQNTSFKVQLFSNIKYFPCRNSAEITRHTLTKAYLLKDLGEERAMTP